MDVKKEIESIQNELVEIRRHLHAHPEQSWHEFETQAYIINYLEKLGIPYVKSTKSGVIATIKGPHSSDKILGIRADIDALPITELGTCEYKSKTKALCMHAVTILILQFFLERLKYLQR